MLSALVVHILMNSRMERQACVSSQISSCIVQLLRNSSSSLVFNPFSVAIPLTLRTNPLPFNANPAGFCAIVFDQLTEPRVLQCLSCGNPLLWVVDKDFPEQIQEQFVELCGGRDDLVQAPHGFDEFLRLPWRIAERICEVLVFEESCSTVAVVALALPLNFADEGFVDKIASDGLKEC